MHQTPHTLCKIVKWFMHNKKMFSVLLLEVLFLFFIFLECFECIQFIQFVGENMFKHNVENNDDINLLPLLIGLS